MATVFESTYTEELYRAAPRVTVVIGKPWEELTEEEKTLLSKILSAVRLKLETVAIWHQPKLNLSAYADKPSKVLCFAPAEGLPKYEVLPANNTSVVVALPLADLLTDDDAKKKLWGALKQMFS